MFHFPRHVTYVSDKTTATMRHAQCMPANTRCHKLAAAISKPICAIQTNMAANTVCLPCHRCSRTTSCCHTPQLYLLFLPINHLIQRLEQCGNMHVLPWKPCSASPCVWPPAPPAGRKGKSAAAAAAPAAAATDLSRATASVSESTLLLLRCKPGWPASFMAAWNSLWLGRLQMEPVCEESWHWSF